MKKIYLLLILVLLTGCTCKYELEFNGDSVKEKITSQIYPYDYEEVVPGTDPDDLAAHLVNDDQYPLTNSETIYNKTVTDMGEYKEVVLEYEYTFDEFKNYSNTINCFENKTIEEKNGEYRVKLSGEFYCLYGDSIDILISSEKRITESNGEKEFNTYKWTINNDNYMNVNIEFTISEMAMTNYYILICVGLVIISGLVVLGYKALAKIRNRNDVNEI